MPASRMRCSFFRLRSVRQSSTSLEICVAASGAAFLAYLTTVLTSPSLPEAIAASSIALIGGGIVSGSLGALASSKGRARSSARMNVPVTGIKRVGASRSVRF